MAVTGAFVIHPNSPGIAAITCDLGEDSSVDFQVLPTRIDFHPQDRLNVLYTQGQSGGSVRKFTRGLAGFDFDIAVAGETPLAQRQNERLLVLAITDPLGGLVEWLPRGVPASTLHTYYHYLMSPPPQAIYSVDAKRSAPNIAQPGRTTSDHSILYRCKLVTRALGTSDLTSPVEIHSLTTLANRDDTSDDNFLVVQSSSIKGDGVYPIIRVTSPEITPATRTVLFYKRLMRVGANTNLDYIEAEDCDLQLNFSNQVDASVSDGSYERCTSSQGILRRYLPAPDSTYFGKIALLLCVKVDASTEYTVQASFRNEDNNVVQQIDAITITGTNWHIIHSFQEMDYPPYSIPEIYDDSTTPTVGQYAKLRFSLNFVRTVGAGGVDVDFFVLAKAEEWIGTVEKLNEDILEDFDDLYIDSFSETTHLRAAPAVSANKYVTDVWKKYGSSLSELFLDKGHDYRLRFFLFQSGWYKQAAVVKVGIDAIYATVYPFETT